MFDFRYHALSLTAVLIALVVGLLLGVAIGDRNLVSSAQRGLRDSLRRDVNAARAENSQLSGQLSFRSRFESLVYPDLVAGRLGGRRVGLLVLGGASDEISGLVRSALEPAGGRLVLAAAVREPPDLASLAAAAPAGSRFSKLASDPSLVGSLGRHLGLAVARGARPAVAGRTRLLDTERGPLLSSFNGSLAPLDGVVVLRNDASIAPGPPATAANALDAGLVAGLVAANVPVVGVETSATASSQVPWYGQQKLASVDDLDDIAGRAALVFALGGAHGAYGTKPTAEALLPRLVSTSSAP
ncbi:MAG TPA: copper transporter [Solirubrobacteraceae bacterium]|jgi:hypothetical protein|nr:copper transporter [Solirubrobacteraceae bacterium]